MTTEQAETLAKQLMFQHGLTQDGWRFEFDRAVRRFGLCSYRRKVISLSARLVLLNDESAVKDTILHEIAHAIAGSEAKHGFRWQAEAARLGARPERCYDSACVNAPQGRWQAICPACHNTIHKHRIPRRRQSCAKCCSQFNERFLLTYTYVSQNSVSE